MAFQNSEGKGWGVGWLFELEIWRHGGIQLEFPQAWGILDLEFPPGTDKSVFLESAYFFLTESFILIFETRVIVKLM